MRAPASSEFHGLPHRPAGRRLRAHRGYGPIVTVTGRAVLNMKNACDFTRDLVIKNPLTPDSSPNYMAVQGWPLVTALYNGIEQALKMLLLAPPDTRFTLETLARQPYGHDLAQLYCELAADDRDHIELHYREHRSLHDLSSLDIATAEQFIAHINSGGRQGGLVSWRYILIQDISQIPSTSLWTMSETWDAIYCRIRAVVLDRQDDCSRLSERLTHQFLRLVKRDLTPRDMVIDGLNHWMVHRQGSLIAAWIDLLVKTYRSAMHEVQAPDWLRPGLAEIARSALEEMASESADPDRQQLLRRIQAEPNLAWNPSYGTFC